MSILDRLDIKADYGTVLVQARIDRERVDRIKAILQERGVGWREFITAAIDEALTEETTKTP